MQQRTHLLLASILFAALLPVTAWGYGYPDYPDSRNYLPRAGSAGGSHYSGSVRLQKGMTADGYYVRVYLGGLRPEDVQVFPILNRLVLQVARGDRQGLYSPGGRGTSRWQMRYRKQLRLPYDADMKRITTSTQDGIMEIHIPKRSQPLPDDPSLTTR
jgi:HSP20 family molecular chaperone IbpA